MATTSTDRRLIWIVIAIIAVLIVLPVLTMGMFGFGPMMGGAWGHGIWGTDARAPEWFALVAVGMQLLFLVVFAGGAYLLYRAVTGGGSTDRALEELRLAFARGELDEDEYERRRERLERES